MSKKENLLREILELDSSERTYFIEELKKSLHTQDGINYELATYEYENRNILYKEMSKKFNFKYLTIKEDDIKILFDNEFCILCLFN